VFQNELMPKNQHRVVCDELNDPNYSTQKFFLP